MIEKFSWVLLVLCLSLIGRLGLAEDTSSATPPKQKLRSFQSHGPYCGIYSIVAAASALGKDVDLATLWVPKVVSDKTGSSAANLIDGLQMIGLDGTCHSGLSWMDLSECQNPLILHYRSVTSTGDYDHWVTCLGVDERGDFLISDPPFPVVETDLALVLANWDGIAIEVHHPNASQFRPYTGIAIVMGCFVVLALVLRLLKLYVSQRVSLLTQFAMISTGLIAVGSLFHFTSRVGIFNHSTAIAAVQDRYFGSDFEEVGLAELKGLQQRGALLIDARQQASFRMGSIPGAISVPVDSSLPYRDKILTKLDRQTEVVVFCQSQHCNYSDKVARFLKFNGFKNIRIYRNGIMEWEEQSVSS